MSKYRSALFPQNPVIRRLLVGFSGMLIAFASPSALSQSSQTINPNQDNPQRREILQLIQKLQKIESTQLLEAAETFDVAWEMAVRREDPLLNQNTRDNETLKSGEHVVNAGARARLLEIFEAAPKEFQKAYEEFATSNAEAAFREAIANGSTRDLVQVILRYQFTSVGQQALENVIQLKLSRGEVLQAALQYGRLARLRSDQSAKSLIQLANLWWRAGLTDEALEYLRIAISRHANREIRLSGNSLTIPSAGVDKLTWLKANFGPDTKNREDQTWEQPLGNYRRTRNQTTGPAELKEDWSVSTFESAECVDCLENDEINQLLLPMAGELADLSSVRLKQNLAIIPVAQPITIGNLLIFRGVAKIRAIDRRTGELKWESTLIDRRLNSALELWRRRGIDSPYALTGIQKSIREPLFNHWVRANLGGQLTSNGNLVFAVEEATAETMWIDPDSRPTRSLIPVNYLRAYDVRTGWLRGQAGGSVGMSTGRGPANPLAGMYFLGAPLVLGDRIYVMAENDQGIFLLQLRATPLFEVEGQVDMRPVHSQLLSTPRHSLRLHPVRRYAGVIPSFSGGLLICNTCDEQVIAVSAEDHSVRWIYRYPGNVSIPELGREVAVLGSAYSQQQSERIDLASRWTDALPRISANRVYLTPRDSDRLICLDLQTGRQIWTRPRSTMRRLAFAGTDRLVLTGSRSVECLDAETGKRLWKSDLNDGQISGRAISDGRILQIPTSAPSIVSVDITTGRLLLHQPVSNGVPGNLLSLNGQLISQNLTSVSSMSGSNGQTENSLTAAKQNLLAGRITEAETAVRRAQTEAETESQRREANELLIETLLESLRIDYKSNVDNVGELKALIEENRATEKQMVELTRAMIGMTLSDAAILPEHWLRANGRRKQLSRLQSLMYNSFLTDSDQSPADVAEQMIRLLNDASQASDRIVTIGDVNIKSSRSSLAVVGKALRAHSEQKKDEIRRIIGSHITARIREASSPVEALWWWEASLLSGFEGTVGRLATTDKINVPAPLAPAIRGLSMMEAIDGDSGAADVVIDQLLNHWAESDAIETARDLLSRSEWQSSGLELAIDGIVPATTLVQQLMLPVSESTTEKIQKRISQLPIEDTARDHTWSRAPQVRESPAKIAQSSTRLRLESPNQSVPLFGSAGAFAKWSFVQLPRSSAIHAYDATGRLRWKFDPGALPTSAGRWRRLSSNQLFNNYALAYGNVLAFKLGQMLFLLDCSRSTSDQPPVLLWKMNLASALDAPSDAQLTTPAWQRTTQYQITPAGLFPVGPITKFGIPVYSGQRLALINVLQGKTEWQVNGLPEDCLLSVDKDEVLLISPGVSQVECRSLLDGSTTDVTPLPEWWTDAMENSNASIRTIELAPGDEERWRLRLDNGRCLLLKRTTRNSVLQSYRLKTGKVEWSVDLHQDSVVSNTVDGHIAVLTDKTELQILNVITGRQVSQQTVPAAVDSMYLYLRPSGGKWLVLTDVFDQQYTDQNPVSNSVHVNGHVYAIDQKNGDLTWTTSIDHEWIKILDPGQAPLPSCFPVLVLLKRPEPPRDENGNRMGPISYHTKIFDVRSGRLLYGDKNMGINLSAHCIRPDPDNGTLTIGFNVRDVVLDYNVKTESEKNDSPK